MILLGNDAISGFSRLLADWALCRRGSQAGLHEWKSMLLSPRITSIYVTVVTLFVSPLGKDGGG